MDILFGNETEILSLYQTKSFDEAVQLVQKDCDVVALTRDVRGSVVIENKNFFEIKPQKVSEVIDSTGAGDLYAAGFLYGISRDMDIRQCGKLGGLVASQIITQFGARSETSLVSLVDRVIKSD